MPRVTGPAFSLSACGSLAGKITWRRWHGAHVLEKRPTPTGPPSGLQTARRALYAFLAKQWPLLSDAERATWNAPADAQQITSYNAYLSYNLERWTRFRAPTQQYPATETGLINPYLFTGVQRGVRHVRYLTWRFAPNAQNQVVFFRSPTNGFTPDSTNATLFAYIPTIGPHFTKEHRVTAGTHYCRCYAFTDAGKWGPMITQNIVTVPDL